MDKLRHDPTQQPQGPVVSGRPSAILERRGFLLPNGIINLQTRCSHRASPHAQSRALSKGPSFYAHGAACAFLQQTGPALSTGTRMGRMRRCSFSTVAYYRPTSACSLTPLHRSHSRSVRPCPTAFFHLWPTGPRHGRRERKGERETQRQILLEVHLESALNGSIAVQHVRCTCCTRTRSHTQIPCLARGSLCALQGTGYVGRPTPCLSRPHRPTRFVGCQVGFYDSNSLSSVSNRLAGPPRFPLGSSLRACARPPLYVT